MRAITHPSDFTARIRGWLNAGAPSPGPSRYEWLGRAAELLSRIEAEPLSSAVVAIEYGPDLPGVLHAACELLKGVNSIERLPTCAAVYALVSAVTWDDEFGEREDLLARVSFATWNLCRRFGVYADSRKWQLRCEQHVIAQDHIRNFFALGWPERSRELNERFLADEAVLLAACSRLERDRNICPTAASSEGARLYEWMRVEGACSGLDEDLLGYLGASVAISVLLAEQHLGHEGSWRHWQSLAQESAGRAVGSGPLVAMIEYSRLSVVYLRRRYELVVDEAPKLIRQFETLGMTDKAVKARFVMACALKEVGAFDGALRAFRGTYADSRDSGDELVACLSLSGSAQVLGKLGFFSSAMGLIPEATARARKSRVPWTLGDVQGTIGELLRDHGDLQASIAAYGSAASTYEQSGMVTLGAYVRIVLSETLLMAGRSAEAGQEILLALPVIEREGLAKEGLAAVAILREALRRQHADPDALRQLREQLRLIRDEGPL